MNKSSKKNPKKRQRKEEEEEKKIGQVTPCAHCKTPIYVSSEGLKFADEWYCFGCAQYQINFLASQKQLQFIKCQTCRDPIRNNEEGVKFGDEWYCFNCCQTKVDTILMNLSQKQIKKCKNCKKRKEVTCADCKFKYTQLVCRHCNKEHSPYDIKYEDLDDGKSVSKTMSCTAGAPRDYGSDGY